MNSKLGYLIVGMAVGSVVTGGAVAVASMAPSLPDPVQQSPGYYKVLLENDEVRVLEYRLKPGQKEALHSHPKGIVYGFNENMVRVTFGDGKVTESTGKAGDVYWRKPVTHAVENIGNTDVHALAVELKRQCDH